MSEALRNALDGLNDALKSLESAVEARLERQRSVDDVEDEVSRMRADRVQLAENLDIAEARAGRLIDANAEVSNRLVTAMESIRTVLEKHDG